jgi:CBS-domain-containing membrane protein
MAPAHVSASAPYNRALLIVAPSFIRMHGCTVLICVVSCNAGILAVTGINYELEATDFIMVIGSFGATAVLVYSAWQAPLAQPRNVIGGHVLSAIVGVTFRHAMPCDAMPCHAMPRAALRWPPHARYR